MLKNKFIYILSTICFIIITVLSSIDFWAFNDLFYKHEFKQNDTYDTIGISEEDLDNTKDVLLGYIKDDNDDLYVKAIIKGSEREDFNEKEKLHMVDVKNLYRNAMLCRNILFVVFVICLFFIFNDLDIVLLFTMFKRTLFGFLSIITALCLYALMDFNSFWINFHYIFFTNELFFLDPNKDILIQIVPERFFFDLVFIIVITIIFILVLAYYGLYKGVKKS